MRAVSAAWLALVTVTGCSLQVIAPPPTPSVQAPTPSVQACPTALLEGTLVQGDDGSALVLWEFGEQPVQWPEGYVVEREPEFRLLDNHGDVVTSEGEPIYVGGGFTPGDKLFVACGHVSSNPP